MSRKLFDTPTTMENVGDRAHTVYESEIRHLVEPRHSGKFIAVEPESGDYVVDDQIVGALLAIRTKHPGVPSHITRIGHEAAIVI